MNWIKLKIAEAIGGKQPISKKLLLVIGAIIATVIFLINGVTSTASEKVAVSVSLPSNQPVIKPATLYVHIVGEVKLPGIYQLDSGSRLVDLIFAAGGFLKKADQASINLARELTDGEQVLVFKIGASPELLNSSQKGGAAGAGGSQISLNRSSQAQLEELPGVGPALAGRMMDWRNANGGFKKKEDLLNVSGIGDKLFAGIKDRVTL